MEWESYWPDNDSNDSKREDKALDLYSDPSIDDNKENNLISIDLVLPDDLLEYILACLPVESIFKATCVCKKWKGIVSSRKFLRNISSILEKKPWYFMFTGSNFGYAYDPMLLKWYSFELPHIRSSSWHIASSCGLICFMDNYSKRSELYVCHPITKWCREFKEPPISEAPDYRALAMSVDRSSQSYTVAVLRSKQASVDSIQYHLSILVYHSETMTWTSQVTETLAGWRGGNDIAICGGILYFLVFSTGGGYRHGLLSYNLSGQSSSGMLIETFIPVPCFLTCGRLMNLKNKLVLVGAMGKQDRPDIVKGVSIWVLNGCHWELVSRMPHKIFQGFKGEFDDVFSSSGADDFIYIQTFSSPSLALFNMNLKLWKWTSKCPVSRKLSPLNVFSGFCFEPQFEVVP